MFWCYRQSFTFWVFNYLPLYGIQIAFKDYKAVKGIAGSPWVGLKHFKKFASMLIILTD